MSESPQGPWVPGQFGDTAITPENWKDIYLCLDLPATFELEPAVRELLNLAPEARVSVRSAQLRYHNGPYIRLDLDIEHLIDAEKIHAKQLADLARKAAFVAKRQPTQQSILDEILGDL